MSELEEKLVRSIELAKTGFENAQARIGAIDTKVGVAVGLIIVLLPAPLAMVGWLIGLEKSASSNIFIACSRCWFLSFVVGFFLLCGMFCAFAALLRGISCLTPRGPKGYGKCLPFQEDWRPNFLFPLHKPDRAKQFCEHIRKLQEGVDLQFVANEYDHQLQQLGCILHAKFVAMNNCFWWLSICLASYGIAVLTATIIGLLAIFHAATP